MAFSIKDFAARINWRQIVVHALAFWFFMYAFETLAYLFHIDLIDASKSTNLNMNEMIQKKGIGVVEITSFLITQGFAEIAGILIAVVLSFIISFKNKWFWFNSLLSLLLIFLFMRLRLTGWDQIRDFFYLPGRLSSNIVIELLINGMILLTIGLLLLFSKPIKRFIAGNPALV